ncbi:MAG: murein biosynthesis integral membrane protein MurJ [Deltaproteobacteria bacterium]|nr:murein biosynthesis integral membrane protein MurJ [Deltaproteobacteria bacterium]
MADLSRQSAAGAAAQLLTRVSGLLREVVFAAVFGAGADADAYLAALRVPNLLRDLFAEGSLSSAFVPHFAKALQEEGRASAWALSNALLGVLLLALGALAALLLLAPAPWVWLVAAGFSPEKAALTARLIQGLAPLLAGISLASVLGGMLHVQGRFFLPALAPAAFNAAVIGGCLVPAAWATRWGLQPLVLVAAAASIGGLLQAAVQLPALYKLGFRLRPSLRGHPLLRPLLGFMGPAILGVGTVQAGVLIDLQIASTLGDGPVSWLGYAFRLVQLPMTVFAGSIAVVSLARLSALLADGAEREARDTLGSALSLTTFLVLPGALALGLFAEPLVALFYQRGAFSAQDTAITAQLLRAYSLGAVAFALHRVAAPSFYAWRDPWTPMLLSLGTVAAKIPLSLTLAHALGVTGLPLAHAAVASAEGIALLALLGRRAGGWADGVWRDLAKITVAATLTGVLGWALIPLTGASLLLLPPLGVAYLSLAALLGLPQVRQLARLLRPGGLPPHLHRATVEALTRHAGAPATEPTLSGGVLTIHTGAGRLTVTAVDGALRASHSYSPPLSGPPLGLTVVLDLSQRPPPLHGLELRVGDRTVAVTAAGDAISLQRPSGPRLPVLPRQ